MCYRSVSCKFSLKMALPNIIQSNQFFRITNCSKSGITTLDLSMRRYPLPLWMLLLIGPMIPQEVFLLQLNLQGVDRKDKYVLTDPAINCLDPKFGRTNLGQLGMKYFFKTHSCGDVCSKMGLKPNQYYSSSTTFAEKSTNSSGGRVSALQKILSLKKP